MIGVVVIGRNEGDALRRALASVAGHRVVYVDSASTDNSVAIARAAGVDVIVLDAATPLSAARARNAGVEHLTQRDEVEFVQFVDGDCMLDPTWLPHAAALLRSRDDVAAVAGQLCEMHPERSLFNRLIEMEWRRPAGEAAHCGGVFMVRSRAFAAAGGFDDTLTAGEEPDLCRRLRADDWKLLRDAAPMGVHDAALTRWSQWSARQQRGGWASLCQWLRGNTDYRRQVFSTWAWTLGWVSITTIAWLIDWRLGAMCAATAPLQAMRLAWRSRRQLCMTDAVAFGALTMIGKWQQLLGQLRWLIRPAAPQLKPALTAS